MGQGPEAEKAAPAGDGRGSGAPPQGSRQTTRADGVPARHEPANAKWNPGAVARPAAAVSVLTPRLRPALAVVLLLREGTADAQRVRSPGPDPHGVCGRGHPPPTGVRHWTRAASFQAEKKEKS